MYYHPVQSPAHAPRHAHLMLEDAALATRLADLDRRFENINATGREKRLRRYNPPVFRRRLAEILFEAARRLDPATVIVRGLAAANRPRAVAVRPA